MLVKLKSDDIATSLRRVMSRPVDWDQAWHAICGRQPDLMYEQNFFW